MIKTGEDLKCIQCSKIFYVPGWRMKDSKRGKYCSKECADRAREGKCYSKPPVHIGSKNPMWKGNDVGYSPLHRWVRRWKGSPKFCSNCGSTEYLTWASISREYKRDLSDWKQLCQGCNLRYDHGHYGAIRRKYVTA